jgi:hypothetical protein
VRTIDLGDLTTTPGAAEGASFYFASTVDVDTNDMFLPLARSPFGNPDRVTRRVIFPDGIGAAESITSFVVSSGNLAAVETILDEVYPPVFVV